MNQLRQVTSIVQTNSPTLYRIVIIHLILGVVCLIGLMVDDNVVKDVNAWTKPLKFCISGAIYVFTVGYLTTLYPYSDRKRKIVNNTIAWAIFIEIIIITIQAFRGVQSHYNISSPIDGILFGIMGSFIAIIVLFIALFIIDTARLKLKVSRPIQVGILLGWLVVFFGSYVGGQMISQMSHNVGIPDGGEGLPIINWSTTAGDLRIAHFFGLHGIQIIPLFALWVSNKWNTTNRNQILAIVLFALLYGGWIAFTFYQAKQGIPLIEM